MEHEFRLGDWLVRPPQNQIVRGAEAACPSRLRRALEDVPRYVRQAPMNCPTLNQRLSG